MGTTLSICCKDNTNTTHISAGIDVQRNGDWDSFFLLIAVITTHP